MHGLANMAEDPLDCEESLRGEVVLLPAEIMEELATLGPEHLSGIMKELGTLALELLKGWERCKNAGRAALLHFHCS